MLPVVDARRRGWVYKRQIMTVDIRRGRRVKSKNHKVLLLPVEGEGGLKKTSFLKVGSGEGR